MKQILSILVSLFIAVSSAFAQPELVGHRGSGYGVENTEEAFRKGAALGYPWLETDIKVTKDSKFVLCHDDDLTRWGSSLTIAGSNFADLQAVPLTQTRSGVTYTGHLMELEGFLDLCTELNVKPVIELKWATGVNTNDQSNIPLLIQTIEKKGFRNKCVILTSMKNCLSYIRTNYPDITLQLLISSSYTNHIDWCIERGIDVDIEASVCTEEAVDAYHKAGLKVNMWTTNTTSGYQTYASMGCDFITTDRLDGKNLPTYEPKVMLSEVENDYPDEVAGSITLPKDEYTFQATYTEHIFPELENRTIRRIVAYNDRIYLLALDATNQPTILVIDPKTKDVLASVSTANMLLPIALTGETNRMLMCSDIQVTNDGVLIASNLAETCVTDRSEVTFYRWENDVNGLPTGDPIVWVKSLATAGTDNAYAGETFAYSGTLDYGNIFLSCEVMNSAANIRIGAIPIIDSIAANNYHTYTIPPARGYLSRTKMGDDYRFNLSPISSTDIVVTSSSDKCTLGNFTFVKKESTGSPTDIPASLNVSTAFVNMNFFRYAGTVYAVIPTPSGITLLDVSGGINKASIVTTYNTTLSEAEGTIAAAGQVFSVWNEELGYNINSQLSLIYFNGNKATHFLETMQVSKLEHATASAGKAIYYTLQGLQIHAHQLSSGVYIRQEGEQVTKVLIP